ncbi:MAG: cell division protein SepF [Clostridia bacterium]|nr:cell division protein SepF [Clostridia bacterium]
MAVGDMMNGLKRKMERFLYGDEEQPRAVQQPQPFAPAPDAAFTQQPQPQYAPPMQANYYQPQQAAPQQPAYQPQAAYQQPQQPVYPQPVQPQPAPQQAAPQNNWNSRFGQKQEKVVNIRDYQQPAPEMAAPADEGKPAGQVTTRVVCARGMMDCRLAITLLRAGDAVLVTMENIKDPAEMRRLVDTLSGACYSLSASITKVSRYGVYLLAPQSMVVYADQLINQMNGAAPKAQRPVYQPGQRPVMPQQPAYQPQAAYQQPQQPAYQPQAAYQQPQQPVYQPQAAYQHPRQEAYQPQAENAYQQNAFTQRTAAPQENNAAFYARPQQVQAPQMPAFSSQSANSGYVPDDMEVAE